MEPAPLGLKLYDSPYGSNGPELSTRELSLLAQRLGLESMSADQLLERFPLLAECRDGEDRYYLDLVLQVLQPKKGDPA